MSLIDDLARVREMGGRAPLPDPGVIQGFEPGSPPVPPYSSAPVDAAGVPFEEEDEFGLSASPPVRSPLVPRKRPAELVPATPSPAIALAVVDRVAVWKGREIALSEGEEKQVRAIVLRAIAREVAADLTAAGARRPRRKREPDAEPPKRGRPRKAQP